MERYESNNGNILDQPQVRLLMNRSKIETIKFNILKYSPSYSIEHDLHWIKDGTVRDQIDVALERKSMKIYANFLKDKITKTENEVIKFLKSIKSLHASAKILENVIYNLKKGNYSTANILLVTLIEGLARLICKTIYSNQNPNLSQDQVDEYIYSKFLSLESLILEGEFNPDYEISIVDAFLLSQHLITDELEPIEQEFMVFKKKSEWLKNNLEGELTEITKLLGEHEPSNESAKERLKKLQDIIREGPMNIYEKRKISIKPRLEFLLRTLKQDRNLIIHGKYAEFDKDWKSYLYLSALIEVNQILKEYGA